jgi:protein FAM32A
MKAAFTGGALSFKGEKKAKKKTKSKHQSKLKADDDERIIDKAYSPDDDLTEAERRALVRKREREHKELEMVAKKSHRERVEEFNEKLGSQTELNDIPRVSAAGNG